MKLKIYAEESYTTTVRRSSLEIESNDYPELLGMSEDEISDYIDNHSYDMKSTNEEVYSSLGEELSDQDVEYDDVSGDVTEFYVEQID